MHRFHVPPGQCGSDEVTLTGREAHHGLHVLRLRRSDPVVVLDGAGREYHGEALDAGPKTLRLKVHKTVVVPPLPCRITLLQAVPKGKLFDDIVHRATELGVFRIVPLLSQHVVTRLDSDQSAQRLEHWRTVAVEAIKQSGSAWLPQLEPPLTPAAFLRRQEPFDLSLIASLQPGGRHPRHHFTSFRREQHPHASLSPAPAPVSACIWIGPEGDFTKDEVDAAIGGGAQPISLGRLVLRVETAAIYCLSIRHYELQAPVE